MGTTVIGDPIIKGRLESHRENAFNALMAKNKGDKNVKARQYADTLIGNRDVGTRVLIYNATGDTIFLDASKEWSGKVGPSPYPPMIHNGQWGVFFHGYFGSAGSASDLVYKGRNSTGTLLQWVVSWRVSDESASRCITEIRPEGYYNKTSTAAWKTLYAQGSAAPCHYEASDKGCKITASIGNTNRALLEVILTVDGFRNDDEYF